MGTRDCPRRSRHVHTEGVRGVETPQGGVAAFAVGSFGIRSEGEAAAEDRPHPCGVGGKDVHSRGRWSRHEPGGTGRSTGMEGVPRTRGVGRCFVHGGRGIAEAKPQPPGGVAAFAVGGVPFYSFSSF